MKSLLLCGGLLLATDALAHRLDEYLQVARVSVATNLITLSLELTPGVAVADQVLVAIDTDRDGKISELESTNYAARVFSDLNVRLDEKPLTLKVAEVSFPTVLEMKAGVGVIRIKGTALVEPLAAGNHALSLTNTHLPAISVYLVNAYAPKDPAITITKQTRDESQADYELQFAVAPMRQ